MKRILLFITALLFVFNTGHGQTNVYHPFPTDSASWCYRYSPMTGSESVNTATWLGDTIINLKTYTKVFDGGNSVGIGYVIGVRQDIPNEKVYAINASGVETDVSVSQHLLVGDTFPPFVFGIPEIIQSIDSTFIINKYHKSYHLQYGSYIVGVGKSTIDGDTWFTDLLCFNVGSPMVACNVMPPQCNYASIRQYKNNSGITFNISPNPSSVIISVASNVTIDELKVSDMLGQLVYEAKPNAINTTLTLPDAGVYFITLTSGTEKSTKKVIVCK